MELARLQNSREQAPEPQKDDSRQQGFALVSLVVVLPLGLALICAVSFYYATLARKSAAQSLCVRTVVKMQSELGLTLAQLLRLNPRATQLRAERQRADANLEKALLTGDPPAIAVAQAYQLSVIVAQLALRGEQQGLLVEARETRLRHRRDIEGQLTAVAASRFHSRSYYGRALAVREEPALSLTPDYVTVSPFEILQQHRFEFAVSFNPPVWPERFRRGEFENITQPTACAATLQEEGKLWNAKILVASALSKPR